MPKSPAATAAFPAPDAATAGRALVVGLVLLGLVAAIAAILFQRQQTRRCLEFYGADHARRIAAAPLVELLDLEPAARPGLVVAHGRRDISRAAGLVHLRRGLVEDANFVWGDANGAQAATAGRAPAPDGRLPTDAWDIALEFVEPVTDGPGSAGRRTQLVFDLDPGGGAVAVVGRPGRIGLGRIGPGLRKWIRGLADEAASAAAR